MYIKFGKIMLICSQDNKNLPFIKDRNSVTKLPKMTGYNPNLDLVNMNAHTEKGQTLSISSQDMERKPKSDINHGP